MRITLLFLLTISVCADPFDPATDEAFDQYVQTSMESWQIPGVALGVIKDGKVVLAKGYGVKKVGTEETIDEYTLFPIASLTKAFTAMLAAILVDEEKLSWDDPVKKHLPTFTLFTPDLTENVTLRDLLCHRTGLEKTPFLWLFGSNDKKTLIEKMRWILPKHNLRSHFSYNNLLYAVAGLTEEAAGRKTWEELIQERIFTPLGMDSSLTHLDEQNLPANVTSLHTIHENCVTQIPIISFANCRPAISIYSNIVDLLQWMLLHLGEGTTQPLVSKNALHEMHSPQIPITDREWRFEFPGSKHISYGLGWVVHEYKNRTIIEHTGSLPGGTSLMAIVPEERLGIVILINRDSWALFPKVLKHALLDAYFDLPFIDWNLKFLTLYKQAKKEKEKEESAYVLERQKEILPKWPLEKYAGIYSHPLYGPIELIAQGGELTLCSSISFNGKLEHWEKETFRLLPPYEPSPIEDLVFVSFYQPVSHKSASVQIHTSGGKEILFSKLSH